jgi:hypothetical protein
MSQDIGVNVGSDQPLPQDATLGAVSEGAACSARRVCWVTRSIRAATALLVLGAAGAYGAVSIHPELANYAWFVPENSNHASKSGGSCSSGCPLEMMSSYLTSGSDTGCASSGCASAARSEEGCCSASKGAGCPLSQPAAESSEAVAAVTSEEATTEEAGTVSDAAAESTPAEAVPVDVQPKTDLPGVSESDEKISTDAPKTEASTEVAPASQVTE